MSVSIDPHDEYRRLLRFYDSSIELLDRPDDELFTARPSVSAWSPAQHLFHTWLSAGRMLKAVQLIHHEMGPVQQDGQPSETGRYVLQREQFVRGAGQAPENVHPPAALTREDLQEALDRSRSKLSAVRGLLDVLPTAEGRLAHHRFGALNALEWLRVTRVHAEHHLAIIDDVLEAA